MANSDAGVAADTVRPDLLQIDRWDCPIHGCEFVHFEKAEHVPAGVLAGVFGPGVFAATAAAQRKWRVEQALKEHFATHSNEDYLREISRLRALLVKHGHPL